MAVAIIHDAWTRVACLYDNTTDTAFGPVFTGPDAGTDAEDFLDWLAEVGPSTTFGPPATRLAGVDGSDARHYTPQSLARAVKRWQCERAREPDQPHAMLNNRGHYRKP